MRFKRAIGAVIWLMVLCQTPIVLAADLAGSEWGPDGNEMQIVQFKSEGKLGGNGGCNSFFSNYKLVGNRIEVGPIASTRKFCGTSIMKSESRFLQALEAAVSFRRSGHALTTFDGEGKVLLRLKQRDWD